MFSHEAQVKQESGQDRKKLLSLLRRLRRHAAERRAAERRAVVAVDRYLVSAGPAPANPPHLAAAVYSWNRQTDGRTSSDTVPAA